MPEWIEVKTPSHPQAYSNLGPGECEAIALAKELDATEVLIDERLAREIAIKDGLAVTGTVGVLEEAASRGLIDLPTALERLRLTNFRFEEAVFQSALDRDRRRKQGKQSP